MIKILIHSYLDKGERVNWRIVRKSEEYDPVSLSDQLDEYWLVNDEGLAAIKRQELLAIIDAAQDFCKVPLWNQHDICQGEVATADELLEFLKEKAGLKAVEVTT
jgi:hypothetical protein